MVSREIPRFLIVGGLATAISLVGFNVLVHGLVVGRAPLRDHAVTGFVLANAAAGLAAYFGTRLWAFGHRQAAHGHAQNLGLFFLIGGATMALPVVFLSISRHVMGLESVWADNVAANVLGLGVGTALRFWLFRRHVFVATVAA